VSQMKKAELRLDGFIQEGYDLVDEFKSAYKRLQELLPDLPKSMSNEKQEIHELMQKLAAASRELKQEIKDANAVVSHIRGHTHWKAAVRACFGEDGLAEVYTWFEENKDPQEIT
jgi:predicted  nucleic acid-binding Zn-ribbon protein